ncbi:hypothetical protein T4E_3653 [Trichinella pseudospiralis]|uniref:Uncharacterized protein n=1 Tax=Trichinella pseudospiralis TaxID=6337 RepID=A0A0V0XYJ8_TRIPS|nr:hypothetical protein T4E_3653 [Trichinella pseudospiralis]
MTAGIGVRLYKLVMDSSSGIDEQGEHPSHATVIAIGKSDRYGRASQNFIPRQAGVKNGIGDQVDCGAQSQTDRDDQW